MLLAGALIIGVPVGILTAVFMARFCPGWLYKVMKPAVNLMAGIPSVVYGFFGLVVLCLLSRDFRRTGNERADSFHTPLGIMILPTIISMSESSLRAVPQSYYEAGWPWELLTKEVCFSR